MSEEEMVHAVGRSDARGSEPPGRQGVRRRGVRPRHGPAPGPPGGNPRRAGDVDCASHGQRASLGNRKAGNPRHAGDEDGASHGRMASRGSGSRGTGKPVNRGAPGAPRRPEVTRGALYKRYARSPGRTRWSLGTRWRFRRERQIHGAPCASGLKSIATPQSISYRVRRVDHFRLYRVPRCARLGRPRTKNHAVRRCRK